MKITALQLIRVTRLGEISPVGRLFTLGSILKIIKVTQYLATLGQGKIYVLYLQRMCWATFWAILSQTNMVTLQLIHF
jgi:hypothetical protein